MIQKVEYLYELLYRGGPAGFKAAHQWHAVALVDTDTGEVLDDGVAKSNPTPVTQEAAAELLGDQVSRLIEVNATLVSEKDAIAQERDIAIERAEKAEADNEKAEAAVVSSANEKGSEISLP